MNTGPGTKSVAADLHERATDAYKNLVKHRRVLEFQKPAEKRAATDRILKRGLASSATGAEKLVDADDEYRGFCNTLTNVIITEIEAKEELIVARALRLADISSAFGALGPDGVQSQERPGGPEHQP